MADNIKVRMGLVEWSLFFTLSLLWGSSFLFISIAVSEIPPLTVVNFRVGIAAIALWVVVYLFRLKPILSLKNWLSLAVMGLLSNAFPFLLIVWGQQYIASGLASILNATTPLFTVVIAGFLLADERISALKIFGVLIGFAGVVFMIGLPKEISQDNLLAQLAILAAAVFYALAGVYGRRFKKTGIAPIVLAAGQVTTSAIILLPITLTIDGWPDFSSAHWQPWGALITLALSSTAIAYVLYFKLLASAGATNSAMVTLMIPVFAVLLGWYFLDEDLVWIHFVGMLLIAIGLSAIDGRAWQKRRREAGQIDEG